MLLVIDMQKDYPATELVVNEVIKEVRKARSKNEWIFFLQYDGCGPTMYRLTRELKGYTKTRKLTKIIDGGAYAVMWGLTYSDNNLNGTKAPTKISHIKVCGVNTNACVIGTVYGLRHLNCKITVLSNACANIFDGKSDDYNQKQHTEALIRMKRWRNVNVR